MSDGDAAGGGSGPLLRPLQPRDDLLVRHWLRTPEVQQWWGSSAAAEAQIRLARESEAAICRIIVADDTRIGYAQAMDLNAARAAALTGIPAGTWDCDLFIGSGAHRGRGFGQAALVLLVAEVFGSTLAVACAVRVSIRNERTARAYEKAGFRWVGITEDPILGPSWQMLRHRPRN